MATQCSSEITLKMERFATMKLQRGARDKPTGKTAETVPDVHVNQ